MSAKVGALNVDLALETARFSKGLTESQKKLANSQKQFQAVGDKMSSIGSKLSIGLSLPMAAFGATAVKAALESKDAMAQVDAALASMGNAAGRTSDQLGGLAEGLMKTSLYDDDDILRKVTANMLTFGNVAGENFDRAQQAAVDLAARMGTDLQSAALMVGKALNDPAKGITALSRAGIQFTDQQKEQIKTMAAAGNAAGAQAIMLGELEKQFKGSAQAARDADPGAAMTQSFAEFQEKVGGQLIKAMPAITDAITKVLDAFNALSPGMQQAAVIGGGFAVAFGPVLTAIAPLAGAVGGLIPLMTKLGPAITIVRTAMLGLLANPVVLGAAAVIGGIYLAWKNWDKITAVVQRLYTGVKTWLQDKLGGVFNWLHGKIQWVADKFKWLDDVVVRHSYIPDMVTSIGDHMARLDGLMAGKAKTVAERTAETFKKLQGDVQQTMAGLFPDARAFADFKNRLDQLNAGIKAGGAGGYNAAQLREGRERLVNEATPAQRHAAGLPMDEVVRGMGTEAIGGMDKLNDAFRDMADTSKVTTVQVAKSFKDMADSTIGALQNLTSSIKGGGFLNILSSVINFGTQLGSIGAFGKTVQTRINAPRVPEIGNNAMGTNNWRGGLTWVGELGPELVNLPRHSQVIPNHELNNVGGGRGTTNVQVVPSAYFDVVVDGRIIRATPGIVQASSSSASAQMQMRTRRRIA